jgi:hypothetical protein
MSGTIRGCFNLVMMSTSRRKSLDASADALDSLIATGSPHARLPRYTRLFPPFPIRFSATNQERRIRMLADQLIQGVVVLCDGEERFEPEEKWFAHS